MTDTFDIFSILNEINENNFEFYDSLSEHEQKKISFFLLQRWLSCSNDKKQILFINEFVNIKLWKLHDHKSLLYYLCCASTPKGKRRYAWLAKKKKENKTETIKLLQMYLKCSAKEAVKYLHMYTKDDILEMSEEYGLDKTQIDKIKKEF